MTKEHLMQFFKDASSYESIDPPCFNLEDFTEKWLKQAEGIEGKRLVKESDSLPCVISSLPEYDVEEINEIVQELKDGKQTLFEAIGNIWNKGYMTGSGD